MPFIKSFLYNMKEAKYNPITLTHNTLYAATVTYLRVLKNLLKINSKWFRNHISETYHSKVVRLDDASRFININRDIELRNLDKVIPYKHAKDIILKNPQNVVAYECACRAQKKDGCKPTAGSIELFRQAGKMLADDVGAIFMFDAPQVWTIRSDLDCLGAFSY